MVVYCGVLKSTIKTKKGWGARAVHL